MASMGYNSAAGLSGMLRDGTRHFSQEDDSSNTGVVLRNIEACLQLARMLPSSLGPQGRCKLVINHLQKIIVTSDCASILKEVDVIHPAAQLLKSACQKQEEEYGDNTAFVLAVAGELMWQTAKLINKMTWQPAPEILAGYQRALHLIETEFVPKLIAGTIDNVQDEEALLMFIKPVLASKQYGTEETLAPLVTRACLQVMDRNNNQNTVNVASIRTVKIMGSAVSQSTLLNGYCALSGVESVAQGKKKGVKIVIFACGFEASSTEAKGTVLMKNASDLLNYNKTEETKMNDIVTSIRASGVDVIVAGGNVSDMAMHFIDQHEMMCLKVSSKWEIRRLCQAVDATALVRLGPPTPDEMGYCESVQVQQIGSKTVTIFSHDDPSDNVVVEESSDATTTTPLKKKCRIATIVLRASTLSVLNDLERAVDDGIQAIAQLCKPECNAYVYGGGAFEMSLSTWLQHRATTVPGLEQYAIAAFGKALEVIPRTLADNAGWDATQVLANMQAAHAATITPTTSDQVVVGSCCDVGVDVDGLFQDGQQQQQESSSTSGTASMKKKQIYDLLSTKMSALKLAVDATITILKIDQIIMSKPSGGPKQPGQ